MISYLKGKIQNKGKNYVIVVVNDIGYKVFVNESTRLELDMGQQAEFYAYHSVKEDASDLYGFYQMEQLEMFELLLSINGVGPKSALAALGVAKLEDIGDSIGRGDPSLLVKVSGIGKKTAERIVLELHDKVGIGSNVKCQRSNVSASVSSDEIDALMALGYSLQQAREALSKVDPAVKDSGERIKAALRGLGK